MVGLLDSHVRRTRVQARAPPLGGEGREEEGDSCSHKLGLCLRNLWFCH